MSSLTALARLRAARRGRAEQLRQMRHYHLVDEPLVLVVVKMAGEAAAPLAGMVGTDRRHPGTFTVPQPRNRDLRQDFYSRLAAIVLPYIRQREITLQQLPPTVTSRPGSAAQTHLKSSSPTWRRSNIWSGWAGPSASSRRPNPRPPPQLQQWRC